MILDWLRRRRAAPGIPDALWRDALSRQPWLADRTPDDLAALRTLAARFLHEKEFQGAGGLVVDDAMALGIALMAVLPVLHLGLHWYDDFVGIVVHPDEVLARRQVVDEDGVVHEYDEVLAGEAMDGGPVMLSWRDVADAREGAHTGYNVVIHEFAHKIDMRDGRPDGCPPLPSLAQRRAWLEVLGEAYARFREQTIIAERFGGEPTWLDPYGAQSPDEFFAVACEAYFVSRQRFTSEFPTLVPLFDGFFGPKPG